MYLILICESLISLFSIIPTLYLSHLAHWDVFCSFLCWYTLFTVLTIIALHIILKITPLLPGHYNSKDHPRILETWQAFNFLAKNNLFLFYQNCVLPLPLRKFFIQLLGAKVGKGIVSLAGPVMDPYLISMQEETMLGQDSILNPSTFNGKELLLGEIHIKKGSVVGARSIIMPDVVIGKNATVKAMSVVEMGTQIHDNEIWGGIPARKMGENSAHDTPQRFSELPYVLLCAGMQSGIFLVSGLGTLFIAYNMHLSLFSLVLSFGILQGLLTTVIMALIPKLYPFKEGIFIIAENRWLYYRWNLFSFLGITNLFLFYQRDFLPPLFKNFFLRILGARLNQKRVVLPAGGTIMDPYFVQTETDVMVGIDGMLLPHALTTDKFYLKKILIKQNAIIGDRVLIMPGVTVGQGAIIEPLSLVTIDTQIPDYEIWSGVPARKRGVRTEYLTRAHESISEIIMTILVEVVIVLSVIVSLKFLNILFSFDLFLNLLFGYFFLISYTIGILALIRRVCPLHEGEYIQSIHPGEFAYWRLHSFLCLNNLYLHYQNGLLPPVLKIIFLKFLGLKWGGGSDFSLNSVVVADPCLVDLGKDVILGKDVLILPNRLQGESLRLKKVKIGNRAIIGDRAFLHLGAEVGDCAEVLPLSFVTENTIIPAGEVWGGIPAHKIR